MTGPELMRLLMEAEGTNPNALATKLGDKRFQSQIQRFITNQTKSPRADTLRPIAKHFGIGMEAFLDDRIAKKIAIERGLVPGATQQTRDSEQKYVANAPIPIPVKAPPSLRDSLHCVTKSISEHDAQARRAVAVLLGDLALHPEVADLTIDRILAVLGVTGNELQRRSSTSS